MKIFFYVVVFVFVGMGSVSFAQKNNLTDSSKVPDKRLNYSKNEIYLDPIAYLLGNLNAYYERSLSQESAVGLKASVGVTDIYSGNLKGYSDSENFKFSFRKTSHFKAYYRYYFGKYVNTGFYTEVYTTFSSYRGKLHENGELKGDARSNLFSLGLGLGWKYVAKSGILLQIGGGFDRRFIKDNRLFFPYSLDGMLAIGYRF